MKRPIYYRNLRGYIQDHPGARAKIIRNKNHKYTLWLTDDKCTIQLITIHKNTKIFQSVSDVFGFLSLAGYKFPHGKSSLQIEETA